MALIIVLTAGKLGFEIAKTIKPNLIITLSKRSKTRMYDLCTIEQFKTLGIKMLLVKNINNYVNQLKALKPTIMIVAGWRQILSKELLAICPTVGFHPTLLPKGRGPAPILNSILGWPFFKWTGNTLFHLNKEIDEGDIIAQKGFIINRKDNYFAVYSKMIDSGKELIREYLEPLLKGTAPRIKQDNSKATYFSKRSLSENIIYLKKDSRYEIERKIKAWSHPFEII